MSRCGCWSSCPVLLWRLWLRSWGRCTVLLLCHALGCTGHFQMCYAGCMCVMQVFLCGVADVTTRKCVQTNRWHQRLHVHVWEVGTAAGTIQGLRCSGVGVTPAVWAEQTDAVPVTLCCRMYCFGSTKCHTPSRCLLGNGWAACVWRVCLLVSCASYLLWLQRAVACRLCCFVWSVS